MKIMKKIAVAVFAGAMVFGLVSCGAGVDDPNNMINGRNKVYTIDYTNESKDLSRGYHPTDFKHAGAAVQLDFENASNTVGGGVMGLIFDLKEKDGVKSFNVVGVKTKDANGALGFYVSRFENVKDIQDENFGAWKKTDEKGNVVKDENGNEIKGPATETVYAPNSGTFGSAQGVKSSEKDDTITVYVYAIEKKAEAAGKDSVNKEYKKDEYIYKVYLINNKVAKLDKDGNLVDEEGNSVVLADSDCVATIATGYTKLTQNFLAVYANVYGEQKGIKQALKGTWTYRGDYKEVGVDED